MHSRRRLRLSSAPVLMTPPDDATGPVLGVDDAVAGLREPCVNAEDAHGALRA